MNSLTSCILFCQAHGYYAGNKHTAIKGGTYKEKLGNKQKTEQKLQGETLKTIQAELREKLPINMEKPGVSCDVKRFLRD